MRLLHIHLLLCMINCFLSCQAQKKYDKSVGIKYNIDAEGNISEKGDTMLTSAFHEGKLIKETKIMNQVGNALGSMYESYFKNGKLNKMVLTDFKGDSIYSKSCRFLDSATGVITKYINLPPDQGDTVFSKLVYDSAGRIVMSSYDLRHVTISYYNKGSIEARRLYLEDKMCTYDSSIYNKDHDKIAKEITLDLYGLKLSITSSVYNNDGLITHSETLRAESDDNDAFLLTDEQKIKTLLALKPEWVTTTEYLYEKGLLKSVKAMTKSLRYVSKGTEGFIIKYSYE